MVEMDTLCECYTNCFDTYKIDGSEGPNESECDTVFASPVEEK